MRLTGPTGPEYRVVQVHPTLHCNLKCLHCYSASGPELRDQVTLDGLVRALSLLCAEGYNGVGISGGEPLLFQDLPELVRHARALGMIATVTTNGMLITPRVVEQLAGVVQLVAVSLDGKEASHNEMRANPRAFARMVQGVAHLREANIQFGFIFTLTLYNLDELAEVAAFAVEQGAALLQVHPLEAFGRARETLGVAAPDDYELARAFIEVARLQAQYRGQLTLQFDIADRDELCKNPARVFAVEPSALETDALESVPLADLLAPLIVEADGTVVPIQYGFAHALQIGNITHDEWAQHLAAWKGAKFPQFLALCRQVHQEITAPSFSEYPFVNWYGCLSAASRAIFG